MSPTILVSAAAALIAGICILLIYVVGNASMYETNPGVVLVPVIAAAVFLVTAAVTLLWGLMG